MLGHPGDLSSLIGENASAQEAEASCCIPQQPAGKHRVLFHVAAEGLEREPGFGCGNRET